MRTLLDERFAPVTSSIGFLEPPLSEAANGLARWRRSLGRTVRVERPTEDFPEVLHHLEPLTGGTPRRELLVSAGRWTAYFDNFINGSDPEGPVGFLTREIGCQLVVIRNGPHLADRQAAGRLHSSSVQFLLFGPLPTEFINYVRSVAVVYDERWQFVAAGTEQPLRSPRLTVGRELAIASPQRCLNDTAVPWVLISLIRRPMDPKRSLSKTLSPCPATFGP